MSKKRKEKNKSVSQSTEKLKTEDYEIFKYLKPNDNIKLSDIRGLDLQDLLILIDDVYLTLRDKLGIEQSIQFGLEIEFEHVMRNRIESKINKRFPAWYVDMDGSLSDGLEINSPILNDNDKTWKELKKVCSIVKENAKIGEHSGGHIHVGAQILENDYKSLLNFAKLWSVYENILFRFFYGEFLTPRPSLPKYASPNAQRLYHYYCENKNYNDGDILLDYLPNDKFYSINFEHVKSLEKYINKNTFEFRCPNGTLEPVIWQNNVNLCIKLLEYSKNKNYNDDIVSKRRTSTLISASCLDLYNEIYIDQALELCDMLFTNNLDKVYFLRQYFKSFDMPTQKFEKAKKFVM